MKPRIVMALALLVFSTGSYAEGWEHSVGTYLLTLNINADTAVNTPGGNAVKPIDMDFGVVLDNVNLICVTL